MNSCRARILAVSILLLANRIASGNGGAWQTGVPATGNAAASDQKKSTNVTIEDEKLTIDLHHEFAAVEGRYRVKKTGGQGGEGFFFSGGRWGGSGGGEAGRGPAGLGGNGGSAGGRGVKVGT